MFKSRISRPNRIRFQKSRVTGPWDHKDSVSAKKVKKKFHACVPLSLKEKSVTNRVAIFGEKKIIPPNTEPTEILTNFIRISSVSWNRKRSEFGSEPFHSEEKKLGAIRRREKQGEPCNLFPNHSAEDKNARDSVPNHFAEEENTGNLFYTPKQEKKISETRSETFYL
jgi:hypothetical protein